LAYLVYTQTVTGNPMTTLLPSNGRTFNQTVLTTRQTGQNLLTNRQTLLKKTKPPPRAKNEILWLPAFGTSRFLPRYKPTHEKAARAKFYPRFVREQKTTENLVLLPLPKTCYYNQSMLLQLIFNSIVAGLLLSAMAMGFNLIFNTTKVFHLAHGAIYVCGAYSLMHFLTFFERGSTFGWFIALSFSILFVILLSWLIELLIYRPLSRRNASQAITLISSMGVYIFLVNLIALIFGNETKFLNPNLGDSISFLNIIIVPIQAVQLLTAAVFLIAVLWISNSKKFLQVRAMMSNETVASVMGVNSNAIRLFAMVLGSILAAIVAILRLYDTGIDPNAGMGITLSAAVAVIIGGGSSIRGTIIASLLIAFLQTTTEWFLSAQWKEGMTFLLLIIVILWRTEGIVSFKMRVEEK